LAVSEAQAQSASQAKSEFMAAVSHELRTPLTSIRGFAELMELRLKEPSFREAATLIRQAADHLNTLLTEILDLAKVEAGAMPIVLAPHPVRELVQNTADFFAISAAQKGLALAVSVPDETPEMLVCDGLRLKQILNNLLSNALKFTEQGEVRLEVEPQGAKLHFHVIDTGPGIPEHLHELIFEKFRQGSAQVSSEHGGTGLGLAISKHLVEMMGGVIALESRGLGHGTMVTLSLPLAAASAVAPRDETHPASCGIQGPNETPLVLVVDDNPDCRALVRDVLHGAGLQTVEAVTADEGLDMAARLHPALVIADLALSCSESAVLRNGVDLVAALARKPGLDDIPVILLTGAPAEGRALLRSVDTTAPVHLLEKPLGVREMRAAVDHALQAGYSTVDR
jgi:CheY-like chemotaxis protein